MDLKLPKVKGRIKKKKFFTLLLIPNTGDQMNKWRVPWILVHALLVFSFIGLGTVIYFIYGYFNYQSEVESLQFLRGINSKQAQEIKNLQAKTQALEEKIESIDDLDQQVRALVGLENDAEPESLDNISETGDLPASMGGVPNTYYEQRKYIKTASRSANDLQPGIGLQVAQNMEMDLDILSDKVDIKTSQLEQLIVDVGKRLEYLEALPNQWPLIGRITSRFGWRTNPITKKGKEFHEAVDIAGRVGTPVKAAGGGTVTFAGYRSGWGRVVIIEHGYGFKTQYSHNSSLLVKTGQEVEKGQNIARVGNTGRSTGPHLDFRITKDGEFIDPLTILTEE